MALGTFPSDVVGMAVGGGMRLVLVGGVVGIVMAGAVTWSISGFLFGITPTDLATFVAIPFLLLAVAGLAAWIPARRASSVDPVRALRAEKTSRPLNVAESICIAPSSNTVYVAWDSEGLYTPCPIYW